MKVIFKHDYNKEYDNFKYSFNSQNNTQPSNRQQLFFEQYQHLDKQNVEKFARQYVIDNNIDITKILNSIEKQWREIEGEYNRRAIEIFKIILPQKNITVYLTIHDRCSYNYNNSYFFIHTYLIATDKTIMHELWHFYFHFSVGQDILKKFGGKIYNDIKESLTVLLNEVYGDLLAGIKDKGYVQHKKIRAEILRSYRETNDVYKTINSTLKNYNKL